MRTSQGLGEAARLMEDSVFLATMEIHRLKDSAEWSRQVNGFDPNWVRVRERAGLINMGKS